MLMTSIWTRPELLDLLSLWKAAYKAAAMGQSYSIEGRSLTRQNLPEIRKQLDFLEGELAALNGQGRLPLLVSARPRR